MSLLIKCPGTKLIQNITKASTAIIITIFFIQPNFLKIIMQLPDRYCIKFDFFDDGSHSRIKHKIGRKSCDA